jgi:DNA-binding NtrC family response regulator
LEQAVHHLTKSILVVGNSRAAQEAAEVLATGPWSVTRVPEISKAPSTHLHHVVVLDTDGIAALPASVMKTVRNAEPNAAVVMLATPDTPWASWTSYPARPAGLCLKPINRLALNDAVDSALVYQGLLDENRHLKSQLANTVSSKDWAGCTPESQRVRESIATAAFSSGPIVFIGNDGCGRRLAAELVHRNAQTRSSPFLRVDLTSLPHGELARVMNELRGELGPSNSNPEGRVGTLYLAELTALTREDQRTLSEIVERPLPFRLMASAHPSIEAAVDRDRFDEKLFSVFRSRIKIPPLRERRGDIPTLVDHFLRLTCKRFELQPLGIPSSTIEAYTHYDWPGNVSELSMVIERAVSIASVAKLDTTMLPEHFCFLPPPTAREPGPRKDVPLRKLIADIERRIIVETLERVDGSQRRAAEQLRLNPTTLHEKMKRYKILPERQGSRT